MKDQRGDTLIEVLVSTVVLTIVLAGAYAISNRATRINQTAIERTEVANQLTEQAEILRAMRDAHDGTDMSTWTDILNSADNSSVTAHDCSNPTGDNAFYLSTESATFGEPQAFDLDTSDSLGQATDAYPGSADLFDVWIVAEESANDNAGTDLDNQTQFHIRGCWEGIGGENVQRSEVIFRLRE